MPTGKVKWFDAKKGYGLIEQPGGEDILVHHASIKGAGHTPLAEGQAVQFEVVQGDKGPRAEQVVRL